MKGDKQIFYTRIKKHYKYRLAYTYTCYVNIYGFEINTIFISLDKEGKLKIRSGYAWDGASGPAIDTDTIMRGSLVHDVLYQLMKMGLLPFSYRNYADSLLHEICLEDNMIKIRAKWVLWGVDNFGGSSANPQKEKQKIYCSPRVSLTLVKGV